MNNKLRDFYERDFLYFHPDLGQKDVAWKFNYLVSFLKETSISKEDLERSIILEIGCGSGKLLKDVATFFNTYAIGIDLSFNILTRAKQFFPGITYIQACAEDLPIKLKKIGLVYFTDLLEHLENPIHFLRKVRIAPYLLMQVPLESGFLSDFLYRYYRFMGKSTNRQTHGHLHRWGEHNCLSLLKEAGLQIARYQVVRGSHQPFTTWRGRLYDFFSKSCYSLSRVIHQWLFGGYTLIAFCKAVT